jgi:methyltransferase (TIGR00027 family)
MSLPNLSNARYVAFLRHVQSVHEPPEQRNPDILVRYFIPMRLRFRTAWLSRSELAKLRSDPFYYYLLARTQYYDRVIGDAISDGVARVIGIGCGSDTRAYRFKDLLCDKGIKVVECDQASAIREKQRLTRRWRRFGHVQHLPIDLNDGAWPQLDRCLGSMPAKTLVLMEGVSPYINHTAFTEFLHLLRTRLPSGSHIAYDFKIRGIKDDFGRDGRTQQPFRLSPTSDEAANFHEALGLRLDHIELSSALTVRLLPNLNWSVVPMFEEDCLVRLRVTGVSAEAAAGCRSDAVVHTES